MAVFDTHAVKEGFGKAAPRYERHAALQRVVRAHALQLAKPLWPAGSHILDLGCGTGAFAREAAAQRWHVTGLDMAYGMCREAAFMPCVNAAAEAVPFRDAAFGGLFCSLMLQWSNNPHGVFNEVARVLKPSAHAVIATLAEGTLSELKQAFAAVDDASHVSPFAPAHAILSDAQSAGLSLVSARQMPMVEHYTDTVALMRALQSIGASNRNAQRRRGLMTPRQCARLEESYRAKFADAKGLPATWQVLFLVLRRG